MKVLQEIDFGLQVRQRHPSQVRAVVPPTSIMRNSLFGTSTSLICFTATASPVPQLKAL